MGTTGIIVLIVAIAAVLALAAFAVSQARRNRLRRTFGPEYDRLAAEHGDRRAAEHELAERERDHRALELRPLDQPDQARFAAAWTAAQEDFIEDPRTAVREAEHIIDDLLTRLGYQGPDGSRQLALASVDHASGVAEYHEGHDLLRETRQDTGPVADESASTEALRRAMQHYGVFIEDLLGNSQPRQPATKRLTTETKI